MTRLFQDDTQTSLEPPFPEWGTKAIAVSDHWLASRAASQVMQQGGNAVDAAVTLSLTLGVVCPHYTGLGGGGFALVYLPGMDRPRSFDFRECAPRGSHPEMFGDEELTSVRGGLAPGIPGSVAGLARLLEEFGTISWQRALEPGIELAERGFQAYPNLRRVLTARRDELLKFPTAAQALLTQDGEVPSPGRRLTFPTLARTYRRLSEFGPEEFYLGETAEKIVAGVRNSGGIFTMEDMAAYKVVERQPLSQSYRGVDVYTIGPPSGGGIQVLQMLKMLEPFVLGSEDFGTARCYHLQAEAMRLSFADRSSWVADPDFFPVPALQMLDTLRLEELHRSIDPDRATELVETPPLQGLETPAGVNHPGVGGTAAYLTADPSGGFVAATESINLWLGSMLMPPETGLLMNNVMDDFSRSPGTPDAFGLVSSRVNQVEPGKRPASSAAPTIFVQDGMPVASLASAGGPRIATTVFQMAVGLFEHSLNIKQCLDAPRIHHQWLPDELSVERMLSPEVRRRLEDMGHKVVEGSMRSHAVGLVKDAESGTYVGEADYRAGGAAWGWNGEEQEE